MATVREIRERAAAARTRANEFRARIDAATEPAADDVAGFDAAMTEAAGLFDQADAQEQREQRFAALERRGQPQPAFVNAPMNGDPGVGEFGAGQRDRAALIRNYSVRRALVGAIELAHGRSFTGVEAEIHQEVGLSAVAIRNGQPVVRIPWDAPVSRDLFPSGWRFRDVTTTTIGSTIPTIVPPTLIELLRARLVLSTLGVRTMAGFTQPFKIPRQNAGASGSWVGEQGNATKSNVTTDSVDFAPKTATANTVLSRSSLLQSELDAENLAVDDLMNTVVQMIEVAAINGAGSSTVPRGVFQTSGVNSIAIATNGGPMTWTLLNQMVGKINTSNAPASNRGWLIHPQHKAALSSTPRESGHPKYLYDVDVPNSPICGFPVVDTTNVPTNFVKGTTNNCYGVVFAAWSELILALMSTLDVLADPFSLIHTGDVRYAAFQNVDINVRHPTSFCICTDATN